MAAKSAIEIIRLEGALSEYSTDGGANWKQMLGVASLQTEVSEKTTTTVSSLRTIRAYTQEPTDVADATFELAAYLPHTQFAQDMRDSRQKGTSLRFRITTEERPIFGPSAAGVTAAIATTGIVTITGSGADFAGDDRIAPGSALKIGGSYHIIDTIDVTDATPPVLSANQPTVFPKPTSAVAAASYSVVTPALRAAFSGEVKNFGTGTGSRDGAYGTTLVVTPTTALTDIWTAVVPS